MRTNVDPLLAKQKGMLWGPAFPTQLVSILSLLQRADPMQCLQSYMPASQLTNGSPPRFLDQQPYRFEAPFYSR